MQSPYDIVKFPIRTEKSAEMLKGNKYLFCVDILANKIQIKKAIEDIYKVRVFKVNTVIMRGKLRRIRYQEGKTPDWKKAIVTLRPGEKISEATTYGA